MNLLKSFKFFLILCIIAVFPNGLFNFYLPEYRTLKIVIELGLYMLIFVNIILRTPNSKIPKYSMINGLILFCAFELSTLFTYSLIRHSKYMENWWFSLLLGFVVIMTGVMILTMIGRLIRKRLPTKHQTQ